MRGRSADADTRQTLERLRIVADFTYDWEYWRGQDGSLLYVSPACERITGFTREEFLGNASLYLDILHPDDREKLAAHLRDDLNDREMHRFEFRIVRRDGQERWIAHACRPVVDAGGQPLGRRACNRDITDRKLAEEALRRSNEKLRKLVTRQVSRIRIQEAYNRNLIEVSLDPLVTIGPDGRITDVNAATERVTGQSRDRLIGSDFSNYFTEPDRARAGYEQVFREGFVRDYPLSIRHADGHTTPVAYNASLYRDRAGKVIGVFADARDITDRQRAEESLKAERQRLYDVLETLPVYVVLLTTDHSVPFANRFFRKRFGESGGKRCFEYLFGRATPCEDCQSFKVLANGETHHHWEWLGPDGRNYDIHDFRFTDSDGSLMVMEMGIDVTERKRAEAALQESNLKLEQRVAERTAEMTRINADLVWFNRAMVGRELRMIELKQEVNELCRRAGLEPRYEIQAESKG
ncbi:MAG: PAS domain S-box protein [Kiritimatiellae bacterium]|nr:PAS domain S-box protein [Kiritimatiellia bacterium]